ncbi:MAG: hypothetical protein LBF93_05695, partial [Zoogloeaceae bacterium]|nr:hypothetical protein [Zoogloeaceae bacterium]
AHACLDIQLLAPDFNLDAHFAYSSSSSKRRKSPATAALRPYELIKILTAWQEIRQTLPLGKMLDKR